MVTVNITIYCPHCSSGNLIRNGKKLNGTQNYLCKDCRKQFISDHERTYRGTLSWIIDMIKILLVRGVGIRDISAALNISIKKVLNTLKRSRYEIKPKKKHYGTIEVDEFWTFVGRKKNKIWLIYAYCRETGEIIAFVWGKRDKKTAAKLLRRLKRLGISYDFIASDKWNSFLEVFKEEKQLIGKCYTVGIEGNNCRLRHRLRRAFRKTCCFSKKLFYHFKAFSMGFFYINNGSV